MAKLTDAEILRQIAGARRRAGVEKSNGLRATSARFDNARCRIVLELSNGYLLGVPLSALPAVATAARSALSAVTVSPEGGVLMFDAVDAHYSVSGLVLSLGAGEIGRRGGQARSAAKRAAARVNGAKGGRPRKKRQPV